jgi:hypothetical protein
MGKSGSLKIEINHQDAEATDASRAETFSTAMLRPTPPL